MKFNKRDFSLAIKIPLLAPFKLVSICNPFCQPQLREHVNTERHQRGVICLGMLELFRNEED